MDQFVYLGDVGHDPELFAGLRDLGASCVFGNWEVSGYRRLPDRYADWVAQWPAIHTLDDGTQCSHATPALPTQVQTTEQAARYLRRGERPRTLFPRLHTDEMARWDALAALETADCRVAFHGHTHVQMLWQYAPSGQSGAHRWQSRTEPACYVLDATPTARYLVGVGSAGEPLDGPYPRYVIYDSDMAPRGAAKIELRALTTRL